MNQRTKLKSITYIALGAVILAICSWISIPTPFVPFTLQTLGVYFLVCFFGARRAFWSIVVYIALGLIGVPVFSSFGSGAGVLLGVTGGFIFGFLPSVALCMALESIFAKKRIYRVAVSFVSLIACYAAGALWAARFTEIGFLKTFYTCFISFSLFDVIKIFFAVMLSDYMKRLKISV